MNRPYRGVNWNKTSGAVLLHDGFTCQQCGFKGTRKTLDCHHLTPARLFRHIRDANAKRNLLTLCKPCHARADNKFWAEHPGLFSTKRVPYPSVPPKACEKCGDPIRYPKPNSRQCDKCRTFTCALCLKPFIRRMKGARVERFCSYPCNKAFRKREARWSHECRSCHKAIKASRLWCRKCWLQSPAERVRPGHKIGRPAKVHPAVATT